MDKDEGGAGLFKKLLKIFLIFMLALLPFKSMFHPFNERAFVYCAGTYSLASFVWLDLAGFVIYFGDPAGRTEAILSLDSYRRGCISILERQPILNFLPYIDEDGIH